MNWWKHSVSNSGLENCRFKREQLVNQCKKAGITAHTSGRSQRGNRLKPTTIGRMRRLLIEKRIQPCC